MKTIRRLTDYKRLQQLLYRPDVYSLLHSINALASQCSRTHFGSNEYKEASRAHCDGFEVRLGSIDRSKALKTKAQLQAKV